MPTGLGITYATSAVGPAEGRQAAGLTYVPPPLRVNAFSHKKKKKKKNRTRLQGVLPLRTYVRTYVRTGKPHETTGGVVLRRRTYVRTGFNSDRRTQLLRLVRTYVLRRRHSALPRPTARTTARRRAGCERVRASALRTYVRSYVRT